MASLQLPNLRISQLLLWDDSRHAPPNAAENMPRHNGMPEPVERLSEQLNLPRLPQPWWPAVYRTLSDYAQTHVFNLTQCTGWTRDQLHEQGLPVSRNTVGFVVRGISYGGAPLHRQPAPTAAEIGDAFVRNVLSRAEAEIVLSSADIATIRDWLGIPRDLDPTPATA